MTLTQPKGILRPPRTRLESAAYAVGLLAVGALLYAWIHLAGVHATSGAWAWSPGPTPPKIHFNGNEYLRNDHPTFPDPPSEDVAIGKTSSGDAVYGYAADPSSMTIYVRTDSHYLVYERPGGG